MKTIIANFINRLANCSRVASKGIVYKPNFLKRNINGFTLIELLVVCAILAALVLIALPIFADLRMKALTARVVGDIRGLEKDVIAYATDKGDYPGDLNVIGRGTQLDPWGHSYLYYNIKTNTGNSPQQYLDNIGGPLNDYFDLYSKGIDGVSAYEMPLDSTTITDSSDDVVYVKDGGNVVLGKEF